MKNLKISMFDSDVDLQQVQILHVEIKVENVQLRKLEKFVKRLLLF